MSWTSARADIDGNLIVSFPSLRYLHTKYRRMGCPPASRDFKDAINYTPPNHTSESPLQCAGPLEPSIVFHYYSKYGG